MRETPGPYFDTLFKATREAECTVSGGESITLDAAFTRVCELCHSAHDTGCKVMFIGNGGSMGIATHMAVDFSKAGGIRATAFGDGAVLTCLGNDLGYESVFARQIEWHGQAGDVLIAISSSGKSPNILNGVQAARSRGGKIVTFSGFLDDNPLRKLGDVNFYVRAMEYGFVEVAHQAILHAILDIDMGWKSSRQADSRQKGQ
jgi:D-sedoheptulose 7-phosphate isomerase